MEQKEVVMSKLDIDGLVEKYVYGIHWEKKSSRKGLDICLRVPDSDEGYAWWPIGTAFREGVDREFALKEIRACMKMAIAEALQATTLGCLPGKHVGKCSLCGSPSPIASREELEKVLREIVLAYDADNGWPEAIEAARKLAGALASR